MTISLEDRLRHDLAAAAARAEVAPAPAFAGLAVVRARRSRPALVAGLVAGLTLVAVPVAAATGALSSVSQAFGWSHQPGGIAADDATGHLVLTTTGPGGQPMQLYSAASTDGGRCLSLLLPRAAPDTRLVDAECSSGVGERGETPLPVSADFSGGPDGAFMTITAPGAARLVLVVGGTRRDLPLAEGASGLYLTVAEEAGHPTVRSYDAAGHQTGETYVGPPEPGIVGPLPSGAPVVP